MPLSWPSMRSIARWVLPVLVGPKTAVTPRARNCGRSERRAMVTMLSEGFQVPGTTGKTPAGAPGQVSNEAESTGGNPRFACLHMGRDSDFATHAMADGPSLRSGRRPLRLLASWVD